MLRLRLAEEPRGKEPSLEASPILAAVSCIAVKDVSSSGTPGERFLGGGRSMLSRLNWPQTLLLECKHFKILISLKPKIESSKTLCWAADKLKGG